MRGWLKRNAEWLWAPAFFAAATLFLYREVWLGEKGSLRWFGWDCLESYWPYLSFFRRALASGELPLWNPFERGGFPFHADPEPALFYPVNWLFALLGLGLGSTPPWMIQAKALLHHMLAGLLLYAYLRTRGLPRAAAATGGVMAFANGPMIIHKASSIVWPVVWAPLVWIATDRAIERSGERGWWRRAILLGGAVALAGSVGSPPGFFFVLLFAVPYGLLRLAQTFIAARAARRSDPAQPAPPPARLALQHARTLAVAIAVAAALLLIIVLPAQDLAAASPRAVRSIGWSLAGGLDRDATLRGLISPPLGNTAVYAGIALVGLALAGIACRPRDRGAPILFALGGIFFVMLCMGKNTPLLPFLVEDGPVFGWFRNPQRYGVPGMLLLAAAAGHGAAALLHARPRPADLAPVAAMLVPVAALLIIWGEPADPKGATPLASLVFALAVLACAAAIVLGPRLAARPAWARVARLIPPVAAAALAVATLIDVDHFFHATSVRRSERPVDDQEDRRWIADLPGDLTRAWRIYDEFLMEQRAGVRLGVRDLRGYPAGDPLQDARYQDLLARARKNPELLQAFNVRWLFHARHHRGGFNSAWIDKDPPAAHYRKLDDRRWEALHPAPAVAWHGRVDVVPNGKAAFDALVAATGRSAQAAVVDKQEAARVQGLTGGAAPAPPTVAGRITRFELHAVRAEIDAPADGLVILNEVHAPGWRVTVDGRAAPAIRANVLLRAVRVSPGHHVIAWTYHPPGWSWLAPLWLLGFAAVLAAAFAGPLARAGAPIARRLRRSGILRAWRSGDARPPR